ncbi:PEP-CTERM sorting domain-containing protein [Paraglaciecola sp.]|uniref:PEP-CTERM sorting domain-containing protein n=1 Tax=Paraglaciecola sp. TaxID=1920173 RepID=UPI0030F40BD2
MNNYIVKLTLSTLALWGLSTAASATPITDIQDFSNNTATEYFVDVDANKTNDPFYRDQNEDWGWTHNAIAGSSFASIVLDISAFDVDSPNEQDMISVFDGTNWLDLGNLLGSDNMWEFTTYDLTSYSWAESQVNAGLQVRINIDTAFDGWLVTLAKSTLIIDGGSQQCVPAPGIPCTPTSVSESSSVALLGLGLVALGLRRRRHIKKI